MRNDIISNRDWGSMSPSMSASASYSYPDETNNNHSEHSTFLDHLTSIRNSSTNQSKNFSDVFLPPPPEPSNHIRDQVYLNKMKEIQQNEDMKINESNPPQQSYELSTIVKSSFSTLVAPEELEDRSQNLSYTPNRESLSHMYREENTPPLNRYPISPTDTNLEHVSDYMELDPVHYGTSPHLLPPSPLVTSRGRSSKEVLNPAAEIYSDDGNHTKPDSSMSQINSNRNYLYKQENYIYFANDDNNYQLNSEEIHPNDNPLQNHTITDANGDVHSRVEEILGSLSNPYPYVSPSFPMEDPLVVTSCISTGDPLTLIPVTTNSTAQSNASPILRTAVPLLSFGGDALSVDISIDKEIIGGLRTERMEVKHAESISRLRSPVRSQERDQIRVSPVSPLATEGIEDANLPHTSDPLEFERNLISKESKNADDKESDNADDHNSDDSSEIDRHTDNYDSRKLYDRNQKSNDDGDHNNDNNKIHGNRYEGSDDYDKNDYNITEKDSQFSAWKTEILDLKASLMGDKERLSTSDKIYDYYNGIDTGDIGKSDNSTSDIKVNNELLVKNEGLPFINKTSSDRFELNDSRGYGFPLPSPRGESGTTAKIRSSYRKSQIRKSEDEAKAESLSPRKDSPRNQSATIFRFDEFDNQKPQPIRDMSFGNPFMSKEALVLNAAELNIKEIDNHGTAVDNTSASSLEMNSTKVKIIDTSPKVQHEFEESYNKALSLLQEAESIQLVLEGGGKEELLKAENDIERYHLDYTNGASNALHEKYTENARDIDTLENSSEEFDMIKYKRQLRERNHHSNMNIGDLIGSNVSNGYTSNYDINTNATASIDTIASSVRSKLTSDFIDCRYKIEEKRSFTIEELIRRRKCQGLKILSRLVLRDPVSLPSSSSDQPSYPSSSAHTSSSSPRGSTPVNTPAIPPFSKGIQNNQAIGSLRDNTLQMSNQRADHTVANETHVENENVSIPSATSVDSLKASSLRPRSTYGSTTATAVVTDTSSRQRNPCEENNSHTPSVTSSDRIDKDQSSTVSSNSASNNIINKTYESKSARNNYTRQGYDRALTDEQKDKIVRQIRLEYALIFNIKFSIS